MPILSKCSVAPYILIASSNEHAACVNALLQKCADANMIMQCGTFSFLITPKNDHAECVNELLHKCADANMIKVQCGIFPVQTVPCRRSRAWAADSAAREDEEREVTLG